MKRIIAFTVLTTGLMAASPWWAAAQTPDEDEATSPRTELAAPPEVVPTKRYLHGFRLGFLNVMNFDQPATSIEDGESPKDELGIVSSTMFVIGYEVTTRLVGHSWLNVLLVNNVLVSGLEQSKFLPSANSLIGFEFRDDFQIGVGVNITPRKKATHMVMAAGWTPAVGSFYVPVHVFFVPDVDGHHRVGATIGVNW